MKKLISVLLSLLLAVTCFCTVFAESDFRPYENSQYYHYSDYDIHYRVMEPEGKSKGKILMLHGFLCSTYSWRNMADIMVENGYECIMLDLPNFGYSTRENKNMETVDREEIVENFMLSMAPAEEWIVAGHSMGGGVSVNIAEELNIKALLLYCPCAQMSFPAAAEGICTSKAMETAMNLFFKYGTRLKFLVKLVIYAATYDWDFSMNYDVSGVTDPVQYDGFGAGMCEMMYNVRVTDMENTGKIKCPVLLCEAEKDIILNDTQKKEMYDAFPDAVTYLVQGGGHQCIENRADELCDITIDFLNN